MKKTIAAFAVAAAASVGMLGLFAGSAGAHDAPISYDCFNVTVQFQDFASNGVGVNTATVTVDGAVTNVSFTTANHTTVVPLVSHSGSPSVVVAVAWHGYDGNVGSNSQTFSTASCVAPASTTTTVAPTTTIPTNVSPAEVVKPTATVAAAVVVAPAFTG